MSVFASSLIFIIFKLFSRYNVDTFQAIIINYIIACTSGILAYTSPIKIDTIINANWLYSAMALGVIFILIFNLMAITTQKNGLSVAAVASKMSIAIPVLFGIIVYQESTGFLKLSGILIALVAVYMTAMKTAGGVSIKKENLIFPILVFLGSGIIDTSLKFLETNYVVDNDVPIFSATIFGFAAVIGIFILSYKAITGTLKLSFKNILAGIALGIPNYFSIYFLIQALKNEHMDSATVFTINNVSILLVSTLVGVLFFKEVLFLKNWIGIILAIISIIMVAFTI
ncbi:hypothetical protein GCM10022393_34680 [Aquimarina addita]|uniref:EamA-like transporter family protein n=1 Tax=Aquimarina addita TaxID=870485 RepID=A0ABP6UT67_9FLAO